MRVVWSWLLDLVDLPADIGPEQAALALTGAGLEVEETETIGDGFAGVVVAEVVGVRRHPEADRLTLVRVITEKGGAATELVCGAPNVPGEGGKVLWAPPGARLPDLDVTERAIKGITSAGMLCSERELGLSDDHEGIVVLAEGDSGGDTIPLGLDADKLLSLPDIVLELGVPANRSDALGHVGVARELAALCGGRLKPIQLRDLAFDAEDLDARRLARIDIEDPDRCGRYVGRVIDGISMGPSPLWMRRRLSAVGVRPLSNVVDITNYVMFELGQPLHAFDYERVANAHIVVRRARADEPITTLDDIERKLTDDDLLICDAKGPVAIAGVMGGDRTEVHGETRRVLLESAHFQPASVRRTARRLGLISESSQRFERMVDPNLSDRASARASLLMSQLCGGRIAKGSIDKYPRPLKPHRVSLRPSRAAALTGVDLGRDRIVELLSALELKVENPAAPARDEGAAEIPVDVVCPTFRPDLTREVDLIEEVLRLHGFDQVPATLPRSDIPMRGGTDDRVSRACAALVDAGLSEAINFGFISETQLSALECEEEDPRSHPVRVRNPLSSEQSIMRTSLLPGLLSNLARNLSFGETDVRLFEVGAVFWEPTVGALDSTLRDSAEAKLPDERRFAAGLMAGTAPGWLGPARALDFFDAKTAALRLIGELCGGAQRAQLVGAPHVPYLHDGVGAEIFLIPSADEASGESPSRRREKIGVVGEIHPRVRERFEIGPHCFGFEIDLERIALTGATQLAALPRFPAIARDVSFFVADATPADRVRQAILRDSPPWLERVEIMEDYRDPGKVAAGQKGMLWSITYRASDRTLTDAEVDQVHEELVKKLMAEVSGTRR